MGIAPEEYCWHLGECPGTQLFLPLERHPRLRADERPWFDRDSTLVRIHGRLSPGVSLRQANAATSAVMWRGFSGAVIEPLIYTLAAAIAVLVALLAGLPPACRAASVDPLVAMRSE